jgi:hypothetical protein
VWTLAPRLVTYELRDTYSIRCSLGLILASAILAVAKFPLAFGIEALRTLTFVVIFLEPGTGLIEEPPSLVGQRLATPGRRE